MKPDIEHETTRLRPTIPLNIRVGGVGLMRLGLGKGIGLNILAISFGIGKSDLTKKFKLVYRKE